MASATKKATDQGADRSPNALVTRWMPGGDDRHPWGRDLTYERGGMQIRCFIVPPVLSICTEDTGFNFLLVKCDT